MELADKLLSLSTDMVIGHYVANHDDKDINELIDSMKGDLPNTDLAYYRWRWAALEHSLRTVGEHAPSFEEWLTREGKAYGWGWYNDKDYEEGKELVKKLAEDIYKSYDNEYDWHADDDEVEKAGEMLLEVAGKSFEMYKSDVKDDERKCSIITLLMNAQETAQQHKHVYVCTAGNNTLGWFSKLNTAFGKKGDK